jgi:uncharacterized membrane protein (UPF0127 family)
MRFEIQYPETFEKGLAGQTNITKPMLFVFPKADMYKMCMRGMLVPIDIIWISPEKKVVKIYHNVPADSKLLYPSTVPAKYAVECAAGQAGRLGFKIGAPIRIFGEPPNVN